MVRYKVFSRYAADVWIFHVPTHPITVEWSIPTPQAILAVRLCQAALVSVSVIKVSKTPE